MKFLCDNFNFQISSIFVSVLERDISLIEEYLSQSRGIFSYKELVVATYYELFDVTVVQQIVIKFM